MEKPNTRYIESPDPPDNRGPAVIINGSLSGGIRKVYGPFPSVDAAWKWAVPRSIGMGYCAVHLLDRPQERSVQVQSE